MQGIYGICEPGALIEEGEIRPMFAAMGSHQRSAASVTGADGVLFGASEGFAKPSLGSMHRVSIAADADLTNYAELVSGHETRYGIKPQSLAELLIGLYLQNGEDSLQKLEGAFAIAIWDSGRRRLLLAVDRHSFRVLYWSLQDGRLVFASRIDAVTAVRQRTDVSSVAVMQYLIHSVVPAPLTIYDNIQRLEAGTQLIYERGQVRQTRYWDMQYAELPGRNVRQWSDELRECMRRGVHACLDGCHPERTGAYLSGGTDSSSVLAFATERYSPFNTFSIYFENRRYDEIGFARTAADHFHARYHERCLQAGDAAEALHKIVDYYEEPFANSSAIGAYHCAQLARESGVDILLAGDGGDELFAGNERYATDKKFGIYGSVPRLIRNGFVRSALNCLPESGPLSFPARYIRRAEIANPGRILSYNFFLTQDGMDALNQDFAREANATDALSLAQRHYDSAPSASSELNRLLYLDVKMTLADNDLRKVTGTAELAGVRVRFPLLHSHLAELSGRIPSHLKLKGFTKRYIFKEAMKQILPACILHKKKHGFGVPVGYWILGSPEMQEIAAVLDEPETRQRGYLRPEFMVRLKELNRVHPAYFGEVLWVVLLLELWHRRARTCAADAEVLPVGAGRAN